MLRIFIECLRTNIFDLYNRCYFDVIRKQLAETVVFHRMHCYFKSTSKEKLVEMFLGNTLDFSPIVSSLLDQNVENSIHPLCHCAWNSCGSIDYGILRFLARSTSLSLWRTEHSKNVFPQNTPSFSLHPLNWTS